MAQKRQRKRKGRMRLAGKYVFRRITLMLLLLGAVGAAVWWLLPFGRQADSVSGVSESAEPSQSESSSEPSEQESEPEPEPEPPAVSAGDWKLLLVNSASPLPNDFDVKLTTVNGYEVDERIADSLLRMFLSAKENGIDLMLCSAYRSMEKQRENYENAVQTYLSEGYSDEEAQAMTAAYYAKPGESEHHTGLAADIVTPDDQDLDEGFAETAAFKWLDGNAHKFGFILRYPKNKEEVTLINYEPWHYRYVGEEHAAAIKESGYCLEEYLYVSKKEQLDRALYEADTEPESEPADAGA